MATTASQIAQIQQQNNQMYIQSAREQMAFQERMSNTAHQREVSDLIKSGLNPVLSATGGQGATTPSGAQAEVDTQSMVSYLINEMNNENNARIAAQQAEAQRYAANMAYQSALANAQAMRDVASIQQSNNGLGWITQAFGNPGSTQRVVLDKILGFFGTSFDALTSGRFTLPENLSVGQQFDLWHFIKSEVLGLSSWQVKNIITWAGKQHYAKLAQLISVHYHNSDEYLSSHPYK